MQQKILFNIKGKETIALISLNVLVILGLILFYVLVLRNRMPDENNVLGTSNCSTNFVQGRAFEDINANGSPNSGEPGVAGILVRVSTSDNKRFEATTPASGEYKLCVSTNVSVRVEFLNLPGGFYPGPHGTGANDSKTSVAFARVNSNSSATVNFGALNKANPNTPKNIVEIGNRLWEDTNGNGLQDPGERGIEGVRIRLIDFGTQKEIASTRTNGNGEYYFNSRSISAINDSSTYLVVIDKSEFGVGKPLDGFKTTKYNVDGALGSDAREDQEEVSFAVVVGSADACSLCIHNYDIGVRRFRTPSTTPTAYSEPGFPSCPSDYTQVQTFSGVLFRDRDPRELTHNFTLPRESSVVINYTVKEGHPEAGCPSSDPKSLCNQGQKFEEFRSVLNGNEFARYRDKGTDVNAWSNHGPFYIHNIPAGNSNVRNAHLLGGTTAESVDYKMTVCRKDTPAATPTATSTPTRTPTPPNTPTQNPTPTATRPPATITPTSSPTPTTTPTSSPTPTGTVTGTATSTPTPTGTVAGTGTVAPTTTSSPIGSPTATNDPQVSGAATIAPTTAGLPNASLGMPVVITLGGIALVIVSGWIFLVTKRQKIRLGRIRK